MDLRFHPAFGHPPPVAGRGFSAATLDYPACLRVCVPIQRCATDVLPACRSPTVLRAPHHGFSWIRPCRRFQQTRLNAFLLRKILPQPTFCGLRSILHTLRLFVAIPSSVAELRYEKTPFPFRPTPPHWAPVPPPLFLLVPIYPTLLLVHTFRRKQTGTIPTFV